MVEYLKGKRQVHEEAKQKASNKKSISLKSHSVSALCFPAIGSELAASSSEVIPQTCCKEHSWASLTGDSVVACGSIGRNKDRSLSGGV